MSSNISAINYDLLVQMALVVESYSGQSPMDFLEGFANQVSVMNIGLRAVLTQLYVIDGNLAATSLATRSPFLTEILLPSTLPELSDAGLDLETDLAISFRLGLLGVVRYTGVGLSRRTRIHVIPLSRWSLRKVRRMLSEQIRQEAITPSHSMGVQYLRDRLDSCTN